MASASPSSCPAPPPSLVPRNQVSFWLPKQGAPPFTPIYEGADGAGAGTFASLNAGAFALYVGGGAINRAFAGELEGAGHDVEGYEHMHRALYEAAVDAERPPKDLISWEEMFGGMKDGWGELPDGLSGSSVVLSELPERFEREGTRAGTVFIDTFSQGSEPKSQRNNVAMVYAVGPESDQAKSLSDFLKGVDEVGSNIITAVTLHNKQPEATKIETLRVCLVSGGLFKHKDASKTDVARSLIMGLSRGYEEGVSPKLNFAFDQESKDKPGSVFEVAYDTYHEWLEVKG